MLKKNLLIISFSIVLFSLIRIGMARADHVTTVLDSNCDPINGATVIIMYGVTEICNGPTNSSGMFTCPSGSFTTCPAWHTLIVKVSGSEKYNAPEWIDDTCSGNAMIRDTQKCSAGHCVDGYCCDSACDGLCERCDGLYGSGAAGTCGNIGSGQDPDVECPAAACDGDYCDGLGNCQDVTAETGYLCTDDCYDCVSGTCRAMTEDDDGLCTDDCDSCVAGICTVRGLDDNVECTTPCYHCDGSATSCVAQTSVNDGNLCIDDCTWCDATATCANRDQCDATECSTGWYCDSAGGDCRDPDENSQAGEDVCEICVPGDAQHNFGLDEGWPFEPLTPYCCDDDAGEYYVTNGYGPACCDVSTENCVDSGGVCREEWPTEVTCDDGIDNDCDGLIDDADVSDCPTCGLSANPTSINFGSVEPGQTSAQQSIAITNTGNSPTTDFTVHGTDWSGATYTMPVGQTSVYDTAWNTLPSSASPLTIYGGVINNGETKYPDFRVAILEGQDADSYTQTITFTASC